MKKGYLWLIGAIVVVAAVALVAAACGGSTSTTAGPATTAAGSTTTAAGAGTTASGAVDAAALFAQDCQGCHQNVPSGSVDAVKSAITDGKGGMPAFKDKLTAEQISALATWVANGGK
jgi:cytochrome c551